MLEDTRFDETKETLSRRGFLVKAGALTAGMAMAGGLLGSVTADAAQTAVTLPLKFGKIDVELARKRGFEGYWDAPGLGCGGGAAYGMLSAIKASTGRSAEWDNFDPLMFSCYSAGINSWGTLCGSLTGAIYIMALALPFGNVNAYADVLMNWYTKFPFPSDTLKGGTAHEGVHGTTGVLSVTSIAASPLCHVSVSKWCQAATAKNGSVITVGSNEKKMRCARLTGDVCAKAAQLLNAYLSNSMRAVASFSTETNFCMSCHAPGNVKNSSYAGMEGTVANPAKSKPNQTTKFYKDDEQGKMDCYECHDSMPSHDAQMTDSNCIDCHKLVQS